MSGVLEVLDTVARGCALHADKCVGETRAGWERACMTDYDEARAAVAELVEAQRKAHDAMLLADWNMPELCSERSHAAFLASAAALARMEGAK